MCQTSDQAKFVMISPEKNNDFYQKSIFIDLFLSRLKADGEKSDSNCLFLRYPTTFDPKQSDFDLTILKMQSITSLQIEPLHIF